MTSSKNQMPFKLSKSALPSKWSFSWSLNGFQQLGQPASYSDPAVFSRNPEEVFLCVLLASVGLNLPFPKPLNDEWNRIIMIELI